MYKWIISDPFGLGYLLFFAHNMMIYRRTRLKNFSRGMVEEDKMPQFFFSQESNKKKKLFAT